MPEFYADPVAELLAKVGSGGWEHGWQRVGRPGTLEYAITMQQRAHEAAHGHLAALENPFGHCDCPVVAEAAELDEERTAAGEAKHWHAMHADPVIDRLNAALAQKAR
jgi:hypothetical protein